MLLLSILFAAGPRLFAAGSAETRAFNAATNAFQLGFYARAESAFAAFVQTYTNSPHLAEAILYQAQARLQQTNYDGAIALLSGYQTNAGTNADQYLFWLAEADFRKGDYPAAAAGFGKFIRNFPDSPRALEAGIGEATARARLLDWRGVIELLDQTNGFFQAASRANGTNDLVLRGNLLLSEANIALQNYPAAEAAVQSMGQLPLGPDTDWQRQYLICRIQLATGLTNEALLSTSRLLTLATNANDRDLLPESAAFQGNLLEQMGRPNEAIAAYQANLVDGISPQRQREALWKVTELSLAQNKTAEAAQVLTRFLNQFSNAPSADLALLTLGEVRLRQYLTAPSSTNQISVTSTNASIETNYLQSALDSLQEFVRRFPRSPLLGNAQLDRGWCFWLQTNLPEAQAAFQAAVQLLPLSTNQATAYFKLGDTQFRQKDFPGAITNYGAVVEKFGALPPVAETLFEPALYQIVQAGLAGGNLPAATNALARILTWYPEGFHTDRALLLTQQEISRQGDPVAARKMLEDFARAVPTAPLLPQVYLAIARTYEQQDQWSNAVQVYDHYLPALTNSPCLPEIEYYRAQAAYKAGDVTNALMLFTNFVAQYPTNEFAPRAKMWEADYYFRNGLFIQAEAAYKMLWRNTNNWPDSELTYQAQVMAGRAAMERGGWAAAREYLTNLYNSANGPLDLKIQAFYAYGDCFMSQDSTNKADDYQTANDIFTRIYKTYPNSPWAPLAWGRSAEALFQLAKSSSLPASAYGDVSNAFQQVIVSTNAPVTARSEAGVGLARTLEKLADQAGTTNRLSLLTVALNRCLDVFDNTILRDGEQSDPFWRKEAGLNAAHLAELLEQWQQAININEQLASLVPSARARFEKNIIRCKAHLTSVP